PTPDPVPVPVSVGPIPAGANAVRISGQTYPLAAVNPTPATNPAGAPYDGTRGDGQLVAYVPPVAVTGTNKFGTEVAVRGGKALSAPVSGQAGGLAVPQDGLVLSGHGP